MAPDTLVWSVVDPAVDVELESLVDLGASSMPLTFQPTLPMMLPKSLASVMSYRTEPPPERLAVTIISDESIDCSE